MRITTKAALAMLALAFAARTCVGKDLYVAQNAAGANSGSRCTDARSATWFNTAANWGAGATQIGPGDTVHLCGTFTGNAGQTMLTPQASGTDGKPITILFEGGAVLSAPYWNGDTGAIHCSGKNYITIDGGTDGKIQNTANGTALAFQQVSRGIQADSCSSFTVRNVTVSNFYIRTEGNTTDKTDVICISADSGDNVMFQGNAVDHCRIGFAYTNSTGSSTHGPGEIKSNRLTFVEHGMTVAAASSGAILNGIRIHDNDFGGGAYLWDSGSPNIWHHDPIHMFSQAAGSSITGVQVYNNYFHGIWSRDVPYGSSHITAMVYLEQIGPGAQVFNNIFDSTDGTVLNYPSSGYVNCRGTGSDSCKVYNNTFVSTNTWGTAFECGANSGHEVRNNVFAGPDPTYTPYGCVVSTLDHNVKYPDGSTLSGYYLKTGSSAIHAGANLTSLKIPALDFDKVGVARPETAAWDCGALQGPSVKPPSALTVSIH